MSSRAKSGGGVVAVQQAVGDVRVHAVGEDLRGQLAKGVALPRGEHRVHGDAHGARLVDAGQEPERLRADFRALPLVAGERFQRGGAGRAQSSKRSSSSSGGSIRARA